MMEAKFRVLICAAALLLASACGGQPKKTAPNDEVTVPMNAEDQAALEGETGTDTSEEPSPDAGPPPAP